jgi:hypothetical protein
MPDNGRGLRLVRSCAQWVPKAEIKSVPRDSEESTRWIGIVRGSREALRILLNVLSYRFAGVFHCIAKRNRRMTENRVSLSVENSNLIVMCGKPFAPSWSRITAKFALSLLFVTVRSGHRSPIVAAHS